MSINYDFNIFELMLFVPLFIYLVCNKTLCNMQVMLSDVRELKCSVPWDHQLASYSGFHIRCLTVNHGSFQDGNSSLEAHAALPTNTSVVNSILLV